jgi:hypothetical protein
VRKRLRVQILPFTKHVGRVESCSYNLKNCFVVFLDFFILNLSSVRKKVLDEEPTRFR